jgi:predicted oxidoreductase
LNTYQIPHTDLVISRLAFGCAMLSVDWSDSQLLAKTVAVITAAYERGIRLFDLADMYGHGQAELALGQTLRQIPGLRDRIVIQSKTGDRFTDSYCVDNSRGHIVSAVDDTLRRLGTDHLDILLLHWPDSLVEPDEVAAAFDDLRNEGKVAYFGVSNHNPWQIELLQKSVRPRLIINQIRLGLGHWHVIGEPFKAAMTHGYEGVATLDYCRVHDIQVQAYSPLKSGPLTSRASSLLHGADGAASAPAKQASEMLRAIADRHRVKPEAIMLAWLLRHPAQIVPIIGTTRVEHLIEDCEADHVELTRQEWYSLLQAAAAAQSEVGPLRWSPF